MVECESSRESGRPLGLNEDLGSGFGKVQMVVCLSFLDFPGNPEVYMFGLVTTQIDPL